jgi:hypothetical protein
MAESSAAAAVEANLAAQSTKGDPALPHGGEDAVASTAADGGHGEAPHADPTALGLNATAWVALAMLVVIALLLWKRVPAAIGKALDRKIAAIREQLDEAAQLRAEAEALKAEYEARAASAGAEAETMLDRARHEADAIVQQAKADACCCRTQRGAGGSRPRRYRRGRRCRDADPPAARRRCRQGDGRSHDRGSRALLIRAFKPGAGVGVVVRPLRS